MTMVNNDFPKRYGELSPREQTERVTNLEYVPDEAPMVILLKTVFTSGGEEKLFVLLLNAKDCPICEPVRLARGTQEFPPAFARDFFKEALKWGAHALMVAYNHPSGDPTPSAADWVFTEKLLEISRLAGIKLLDHLIIGDETSKKGQGFVLLRTSRGWNFETGARNGKE